LPQLRGRQTNNERVERPHAAETRTTVWDWEGSAPPGAWTDSFSFRTLSPAAWTAAVSSGSASALGAAIAVGREVCGAAAGGRLF